MVFGVAHFAMSISELDQGFLAGFLEGEASFLISEQNAGQSYSCGVSVCVRDDDQNLLEWLVGTVGLGRLYRVPAHASSRPQIAWQIDSQADCLELRELLSRCGFHGRRAAELEIWSAALQVWTDGHGAQRRATMRSHKRELEAARKFGAGNPRAVPFSGSSRLRLGYISGIVSAEGCFQFSREKPQFAIHLRQDDRPLLELLASTTGLGRIYNHRAAPPLNPSTSWKVYARPELPALLTLLWEAELAGRKRIELETWAVAVEELGSADRHHVHPREEILRLAAHQLRKLRTYRPSTRAVLDLPRRDMRASSLHALETWSRATAGPLSCVAYARWRREHPTHPTRNTITREFGGWQKALAAAGLGDRVARPPRRLGGEAGRARRRDEQRARVLATVRRFEAEHGRVPRAMEFFRWRLEAAPEAPSQSTVYNLFPGGWPAVLAAL
jgi:hypothetical protein